MAKITGPLYSKTASGTIAKNITFSLRGSGQQCRLQKKQLDRITSGRTEQREKYKATYQSWLGLTISEKENWNQKARNQNMTGYNLYIKFNIKTPQEYTIYGVSIYGFNSYGKS